MSQKKILVIEDSAGLADSLEDMLNFKGYKALKANGGQTGLDIAFSERPDLILLDLRLPDMDGFQVLRELQKDDWGNTVRVLILTAADTSENVPEDITLQPEDILHKSHWGIDNLADKVTEEMEKLSSTNDHTIAI